MSARIATFLIIGGLTVGCAGPTGEESNHALRTVPEKAKLEAGVAAVAPASRAIGSLPDRGSLLAYSRAGALRKGASTWHPVRISEAHAMRAIAKRELTIERPDGTRMPLRYERHVVHPNGNWTWIGRAPGAAGGSTVLTFGEKAVFGTISQGQGSEIQLTTAAGRTWMVETDRAMQTLAQQSEPLASDLLLPPARSTSGSKRMRSAAAPGSSAAERTSSAASASQTVDVVLGYTTGFSTRLGGTAQAVTRLTHLVEIANQAYADSNVDGRIRLVGTVLVDYSDTTTNRQALFDLTGVTCTASNAGSVRLPELGMNCQSAPQPSALQPLLQAREELGADLVSLVRPFNSPEHGSCGTAWLLGAGQSAISAEDEGFAFSVVSDTSGNQFPDEGTSCREEYLAHELGHNMGLQHDRATAAGTNDDTNNDGNTLDPEEYGALPYTFGHVAGVDAGNFYTIMSMRRAGATGYRVFSNPRIASCGGNPCGVEDQADNARGLAVTMPLVATFRATVVPLGLPLHDFDGDGTSDIFWNNTSTGANSIWLRADAASALATAPVSTSWKPAAVGDFNADGESDVLWRNATSGANAIWFSGNSTTSQAISRVASLDWRVAGAGDFNGDGHSDILWRHQQAGMNAIWLSGNSATTQPIANVTNLDWEVAGIGDFNSDDVSDILWRNRRTGGNAIWLSGNSATPRAINPVTNLDWQVAGLGDFNGDGTSDILWRNRSTGANAIWLSGNSATGQAIAPAAISLWRVASVADYNGDGTADILWRNTANGTNTIWLAGNSSTPQTVATVPSQAWAVVR